MIKYNLSLEYKGGFNKKSNLIHLINKNGREKLFFMSIYDDVGTIQHLFKLKSLSKLAIERTSQLNKELCVMLL